jgi:hypothetical protein
MRLDALPAQPLAVLWDGDVSVVIVGDGQSPQLSRGVMTCIAVGPCEPQCGSGPNLRRNDDIGAYVEVVEDLW